MKTKLKLPVMLNTIAIACVIFSLFIVGSCKKDDEESPTPVKITLSSPTSEISESSDKGVTITAQLAKPSPVDGSVTIELSGSADYGKDYTTQPGASSKRVTIPFSKGDTKKSITIHPKDNDQTDGDKKVILELVKLPNGIKFSDDKIVTITIKDDDKPTEKVMANLTASANKISESATDDIAIKVSLTKAMDTEVSIEVTLSGDAQYDTDYATTPKANGQVITLNFAKGEKEQSITLNPIDNTKEETDRKAILTLTKTPNGIELGTKKAVEITITDDDKSSEKVMVELTASANDISESATDDIAIKVALTKAMDTEVSIEVTLSGDAQYDTDYATTPKANGQVITLNFAKGEKEQSITFYPIDNTNEDGDRKAIFTLTKTPDGIELGTKKAVEITITDDDKSSEKVMANLTASANKISESATDDIAIKVALTKAMDTEVSIEVTLSGDAQYDTDYATTPKANGQVITLNFAKGEKEQSITFYPIDNTNEDGDRKAIFTLTKTPDGIELGTKKAVEITITDDDKGTNNTKLSKENIIGTWRVEKENQTIWEWVNGKRVKGKKSKPSEQLIDKFIITKNRFTQIYKSDGYQVHEDQYILDISKKAIYNSHKGLLYNIKHFDGKQMTLEDLEPTTKEQFIKDENGKLTYHQYEFFIKKE